MENLNIELKVFQDYINHISIFETEEKYKINLETISRIRDCFADKYLKYAKAINEPLYEDFFDPAILTDYHKKSVQEFVLNFESIQNNLKLIISCRKIDEVEFVKCDSCKTTMIESTCRVCLECHNQFLKRFGKTC